MAADVYSLNFGAKVDADLPSGTYGNEVVVSVVTNPEYVPTISAMTNMQDVTAEICAASAENEVASLIDTRDSNDYSVAKINGTCWMTQNLRIASGAELTSADSNLPDGTTYTIPSADLTLGDSYTEGRVHAGEVSNGESAADTGYWYNFCAASAGTNCQDPVTVNTTADICPKGWHLPTLPELQDIRFSTTYLSVFAPVTGGYYSNGTLRSTNSAYWWSSTALPSGSQYRLTYSGRSLGVGGNYKYYGHYVRCARSS